MTARSCFVCGEPEGEVVLEFCPVEKRWLCQADHVDCGHCGYG